MNFIKNDDKELKIKKEKAKARELRRTSWWKKKISTGICDYCGSKFNPLDLTMDHIVPLAKGGISTKNNIAVCCKECNNKKKNMLLMDWQDYINRKD